MNKAKYQLYKPIKLSIDFVIHCRHDLAKKSLLLPKIILQGLCVWPDDSRTALKKWTIIAVLISLGIMEVGHVIYIILNITNISKMASACTTASTTIETMAKLATMLFYRDPLNRILVIIWHHFWPANIASKQRQEEIRSRSNYVTMVVCTFLTMAFVSCAQFMAFPLVSTSTKQLPLQSWYPFDTHVSPIYEMMYIWQWFMNQVVICVLSGFDAFFNSIVMICACQFQILQDVLETMCDKTKGKKWKEFFKNKKSITNHIDEFNIMIECVEHHLRLIRYKTTVLISPCV